MIRRIWPTVLLVLVACGQEAPGIGQTSSAALAPQVQEVRASLAAGDPAGTRRQLTALRQTVADLLQRDELTEAGAARVLAAAAEVEALLAQVAPATTTTVAPVPVPTTVGNVQPTRTTKKPGKEEKDNSKDDSEGRDD